MKKQQLEWLENVVEQSTEPVAENLLKEMITEFALELNKKEKAELLEEIADYVHKSES